MSGEATDTARLQCIGCGFAAPSDSDQWESVEHPPLGTVTQCPGCGSTDVHAQR